LSEPVVSVVIPTRGRAWMLARAIRSVQRQTLQAFEVVVVLDGPDDESVRVVEGLEDARIRLVTLLEPSGGAVARNVGVDAARGEWIAFLDDDDEFAERKLELQLHAAREADGEVLVVCRARVVKGESEEIWPKRFPREGELLVDYLFQRGSLRQGEGFLQTSTYFVSRELAKRVRFREDLRRHQDWDWVVRLQTERGVSVVGLEPALTVYHVGEGPSVSGQSGWESSLRWGREVVLPQSRRAYAFFIATQCVPRLRAGECTRWSLLKRLSGESFGVGRATLLSATLFAAFWLRGWVRERKAGCVSKHATAAQAGMLPRNL
jgi:glycosyltransferase involved in cell wall biosynthesis